MTTSQEFCSSLFQSLIVLVCVQNCSSKSLGRHCLSKSSLANKSASLSDVYLAEHCIMLCDGQQMQIAVLFPPKTGDKSNPAALRKCFCFDSLTFLLETVGRDVTKETGVCDGEIFLTDWATNKCSYSSFRDPNKPKIPVVGLATVPGSGNTWTRLLVQRLTGILSGSIYWDRALFESGLVGEAETFPSSRTSFIKKHFLQVDLAVG